MHTTSNKMLQLVRERLASVCAIAGSSFLLEGARSAAAANGVSDALKEHTNGPIFDCLFNMFAYQGISDNVAANYAASRPSVHYEQIERSLKLAACPKLTAHWLFEACGYRKCRWDCGEPDHREACSLPFHDLRNGRLNQTGYSLYLFMRDACDGDFVGWVDSQLASEAARKAPQLTERLGQSLIHPMREIFGVADKVLSMALSELLLAAGPDRPLWTRAGGGMIAIDTLVHNWLHRTGTLRETGSEHVYGPKCYAPGGCEAAVRSLSRLIDARMFNAAYPKVFPRFVQNAIWRFCARSELNICNGLTIDDRQPCPGDGCPVADCCGRVALHPLTSFAK